MTLALIYTYRYTCVDCYTTAQVALSNGQPWPTDENGNPITVQFDEDGAEAHTEETCGPDEGDVSHTLAPVVVRLRIDEPEEPPSS